MKNASAVAEGKKFAAIMDKLGYERKYFAEQMGVTDDILSNICRGVTRLRGERRRAAAKVIGITESELRAQLSGEAVALLSDAGERHVHAEFQTVNVGGKVHLVRKGYRLVPVYGALPAGLPAASYSDAISAEVMPDWDNHFDRWGRVITGRSMSPEFEDGDIAIFESRLPADYNGVHARKDNEDTFKIIRKHADAQGEFWPTNVAEFQPFDADGWEILGVCIQRIRYGEGNVKDTREYPYGFIWRFR